MSEYLTATERDALAEMALLYGTFIMGRFAEVMSSDQEPADDWQERAALEAVDLFGPGARQVLDAAKAEALVAFGNRVATPKEGQHGPTLYGVWHDAMDAAAALARPTADTDPDG